MRILATAATALLFATTSVADAPYRLDARQEWWLLGSGAAVWVAGMALLNGVDPFTSDELAALDVQDINSFDRAGMHPWRDDRAADGLTAASYLIPIALLARDDARGDWRTLAVMWGEATLLNLGVNGVVKGAVERARPYAYDASTPLEERTARSARLSFYSGHTTGAAMNCFFTARVLSQYIDGRTARVLLWTGAAAVPAVVAFARVDSGHHFRSDVMVGYAAGAAIGWLVPELHRQRDGRVSLRATSVLGDPGVGLSVAF